MGRCVQVSDALPLKAAKEVAEALADKDAPDEVPYAERRLLDRVLGVKEGRNEDHWRAAAPLASHVLP